MRLLDIGDLRAPHRGRRLLVFRNVTARQGAKTVALDTHRRGAKVREQSLCLVAVRNQPVILDMRVSLLDQPFCRVPAAGCGYSLPSVFG